MDNQLRLLERAAAYGDRDAAARLIAYKLRVGIPDYGAVPKQIWDFYHLKNDNLDEKFRRQTLKFACKLAKLKPASETRIVTSHWADKSLAVALASDLRFPVLLVGSNFGLLGFDMASDLKTYSETIFKGWEHVENYDAKTPLENMLYDCNIKRCRARHLERLEIPLRTTLVVYEPLTISMPRGMSDYRAPVLFTIDSKVKNRSAAANWQNAIKTVAEKTIANYGRVWYIRATH